MWALTLARWSAFRKGEMAESIRLSREWLAIAERMGFRGRFGVGKMLLGRALVASGEVEEGKLQLREGYALWASTELCALVRSTRRRLQRCF